MKNTFMAVFAMAIVLSGCGNPQSPPGQKGTVRVAVIGGMTMTGMWADVSGMFEKDSGYKVQVVATGPRPVCAKALREGKVDLLTMHSGDITTDLVADGYGVNMRPWTRNDLVIVGPPGDPAGVRGLRDGAEASRGSRRPRQISWISRALGAGRWPTPCGKRRGFARRAIGTSRMKVATPQGILEFAAAKKAYVIVGRMPVLFGKMNAGGLEILVDADPAMRRPYVVMEANPRKVAGVNSAGASALADFLLSAKVQEFLAKDAANQRGGKPLFFPIDSEARGR